MKIFPIILIVLGFLFASCGDSVECTVEDFNSKTSAQVDELNSAITAYNSENNDDNCKKLEEEGNKYIDLLRDFQGCEELNGDDLAEGISTTQTLLSQLACN